MGRKGDGVEIRDKSIRLSFAHEGKPHRHTLMLNGSPLPPTPANVKYAHRLAAEIRDKIRHGTFSLAEYFPASGDGGTLTVGGQLDNWLAAQRIEASTRAGYESAIRFWQSAPYSDADLPLGSLALRALRPGHLLRALASRPLLTGKTLNNYASVMREALALAVTDRLLQDNPATAIKRAKHQKVPPDPFARDEAERIIALAAERDTGQVANFIEFWFWTGLRTSEIFGLQWRNTDLASGQVRIAEAVVRGAHKDRTKTNTERVVRLNSRALAALQRQKAHTLLAGGEVFQDPRYGEPWRDERAFRRSYWTPLLKRLGIRYRRPYNMRHTYATAMLMAGMTPAFCAKQLGHSVEVFLTTYSKWMDGEQNDLEMARLEAALDSSLETPRKKTSGS